MMTAPQLMPAFATENSISAGSVLNQTTAGFRILTTAGHFINANLAASCMVAPQQGSDVLLAYVNGVYYILAVLTHPNKNLVLQAKHIELQSETLTLNNKATQIKTNEMRFDVRRMISFAKKAYAEFGQFFQKIGASYLEVVHQKIKSESHLEETQGLRYTEAVIISEKADVAATQADKILIN